MKLVKLKDGKEWWVKSKGWESSTLGSDSSFGVTLDKDANFSESAFKSDHSSPSPSPSPSPPSHSQSHKTVTATTLELHLAFRIKSQAQPTRSGPSHPSIPASLSSSNSALFQSPRKCCLALSCPCVIQQHLVSSAWNDFIPSTSTSSPIKWITLNV